MLRKVCGGSNLSTFLALWGIYIKKCISPVRIRLQSRKARNASTKFRKTSESKKAEKSLEISAFLVFSCLHLNQTRIMAGMAGLEPATARVKVWCLTAWRHPIVIRRPANQRCYYSTQKNRCQVNPRRKHDELPQRHCRHPYGPAKRKSSFRMC